MSLTIDNILKTELTGGLSLPEEDKEIRLEYWRKFLQYSISPPIEDNELNIEESWPPLVNVLIAKLVIYDLVLQAARDAMLGSFGAGGESGESGGSGGLKSLKTGPSEAEWYDSSKSLESIFKVGAGGKTIFDTFTEGICMLANQLGIKLSICKQKNPVFTPIVIRTKPKLNPKQYLNKKYKI